LWAMFVPRQELERSPIRPRALWNEMVEGWRFLVRQRELFANTLITGVAQVAVGAEIVASVLYARSVLDTSSIGYPENYSLLLAAVAFGSVAGGVAVGAVGEHLRKGLLTIGGLAAMGLALAAAGLVREPTIALVLFFVVGAANVAYLIPTITLFQERTPQRLMGRVVSSRQALTFGVIALSMGGSGWLAGVVGPEMVFVVAGGICAVAGLVGLLVPAMRGAR
jgi:MFS family permease